MSVDATIWYVKLADGDVERFTLDELDDAFQNGQIDENTMVLAAGSEQWTKLADLLGGADASPAPAPAPQVAPAPVAARPGTVAAAPLAVGQPMAARPGAARAAMPAGAAMPIGPAGSLRPVSVDLGGMIDAGEMQYPSSSKKGLVVAAISLVAVLGAGAFFVVKQQSASAASSSMPAFTATQPPVSPALPQLAPPPTVSQPVAAATAAAALGPSSVMDPTQRVTDDQKQRLLEADKKSKAKTHVASSGGETHHAA